MSQTAHQLEEVFLTIEKRFLEGEIERGALFSALLAEGVSPETANDVYARLKIMKDLNNA